MNFGTHIVVDWSGGNDRGLKPKKDAIWVGEHGLRPIYMRNRKLTEDWLQHRIETALTSDERLMIGFDFPFGYPAGFAAALTGKGDPFALWNWFEDRVEDAANSNNRFDLAGQINAKFPGIGPFWGNGLKREIPDLPRKGLARTTNPFPERRKIEQLVTGSFTVWQLSGAGAVGSQVIMGLPVLERLRRRFAPYVSVWPFEPLTTQVAFVEIWPSLWASDVSEALNSGGIKDAHQVRVTAEVLAELQETGALSDFVDAGYSEPEEGWILGVRGDGTMAA